jgi:hypothetical protein
MADGEKPLEPEIVSPLPEKSDEVPSALRQIGNTALDAYFARRIAESQTASAQALAGLGRAMADLEGVKRQIRDLPDILDADSAERALRKVTLEEQLADAKRKAVSGARIAQLKDELEIMELEEKVAGAKARKALPVPEPLDAAAHRRAEVERMFREKMGSSFTEQEVRAHADRKIEEIKRRADSDATTDMQREIDNVIDAMNSILNDL